MLDDLAPFMDSEQSRGLARRLESKEIKQALPAEIELGLTWAISKLGPIEIEPEWYSENGRVPDVFSEAVFPGNDAIIEITALSDAALASDEGMRNASRKISQEAGKIRRGASRLLSYYFYEETVRIDGRSLRRVCVPRELILNESVKGQLHAWVSGAERKGGDKLYIEDGILKVSITWNDSPQGRYNFHTSMPPEIRDVSDNYVYRALSAKAKQIKSPHFKGIRFVILADVGSTALRNFDKTDLSGRVYNGRQIVEKFLNRCDDPGVDVVAIITTCRPSGITSLSSGQLQWKTRLFARSGMAINSAGFDRLIALLPKPRREGYQSRQLHEQAVFTPASRGIYLNPQVSWRKGEKTEIMFSARALLDLLSGRLAPERALSAFDAHTMSILKAHLDRGETISAIRLSSYGPDFDDDHIIIEVSDDPAARNLKSA